MRLLTITGNHWQSLTTSGNHWQILAIIGVARFRIGIWRCIPYYHGMDSVTQIALGAACGDAILGSRIGKKAALWGAALGTLPDLDTFYPFADPIAAFTLHRGYSHSYFVLAAIAPLIAWLACKVHPTTRGHWPRWLALAFVCLLTHPLLDSFTVYGTQVGLPLSNHPVAWSTIFIIDPLYTLPLLIGIAIALRHRRPSGLVPDAARRTSHATVFALAISSCYLALSVAVKAHVEGHVHRELARQGIAYDRAMTTPAPFNILLWRAVVIGGPNYWEGFYSLMDDGPLEFQRYASGHGFLTRTVMTEQIRSLTEFSKGFYAVEKEADGTIRVHDLRMGLLGEFVFNFRVAQERNGEIRPISPTRGTPARPTPDLLRALFTRIGDRDALDSRKPTRFVHTMPGPSPAKDQ